MVKTAHGQCDITPSLSASTLFCRGILELGGLSESRQLGLAFGSPGGEAQRELSRGVVHCLVAGPPDGTIPSPCLFLCTAGSCPRDSTARPGPRPAQPQTGSRCSAGPFSTSGSLRPPSGAADAVGSICHLRFLSAFCLDAVWKREIKRSWVPGEGHGAGRH